MKPIAYVTDAPKTNTDPRYLVEGSKNFLINRQRRAIIRRGIKRLGAGSTTANAIKNQKSWLTSTGQKWKLRNYDDELEVWVGTLDGVDINAWHRVANGFDTDEVIRFAFSVWKDSETLDVALMVAGDSNLYEWPGAVAVVGSATGNTIVKKGTTTWGQARFFAVANRTLVNTRTGTEFTYTGGEGTTTLTGVGGGDTSELVENDILVQKVVTHTNEPASGRNNHTIGVFENNVLIGSNDDNEVYMTANNDFTDTTFSSPRVAGEGGIFTLDGPSRGFGKLGTQLVLFAGEDSLFRVLFKEVAVSTTLAEILDTKRILAGTKQGSFSADTIVQLGNAIIYLSNEPALRYIQDPERIGGINPETLSNPIKPDFDAETFTNAHALWHKNGLYLTAPVNGRVYILEFVEDADGKLRRYWNPPQTLSVRPLSELDDKLYGGSNAVQETLELFAADTYSDMVAGGTYGDPDDKVVIPAKAAYAYNVFGDRAALKTFDEYFNEGELRSNTKALLTLYYDFGGVTQTLGKTIAGSDLEILEETLENSSLGQQPLGQAPLGGSLFAPADAAAFAVSFEVAPEDFKKIQAIYTIEQLDAYFAIFSHGPNVVLSRRRDITIKK